MHTIDERRPDDMIDLSGVGPAGQAAILVGAVLSEAIALYVGYGAIERVATPLVERIQQA